MGPAQKRKRGGSSLLPFGRSGRRGRPIPFGGTPRARSRGAAQERKRGGSLLSFGSSERKRFRNTALNRPWPKMMKKRIKGLCGAKPPQKTLSVSSLKE